jgi:hypothetical protein
MAVRSSTPERTFGAFDRLLLLASLVAGSAIAFRPQQLGDYASDAGPALSAIAHGNLGAFFAHQPAMGAVSLYLRAPFVLVGASLHASQLELFRWGALPCSLSVGVVGAWCARIAGRRGASRIGQAAIVAIAIGNPLVSNAMLYGHPEELLTGSLAVAAVLAASEQSITLSAVLAGLAVASKQWALLVVCPSLLVLERDRARAAVVMVATAVAATVPMVVANFSSFTHALSYISRPQPVTTMFSWLYPFSPTGSSHVSMIFGPVRPYVGPVDLGIEIAAAHPLIICLGIVIPLAAWALNRRQLTAHQALLACALVLLLRCTLDPGAWPYYYGPVVLALLALDAHTGRELPITGLAAAGTAFVVLDRFPAYVGEGTANLVLIAATLIGTALLVRGMLPSRAPAYASSVASIA